MQEISARRITDLYDYEGEAYGIIWRHICIWTFVLSSGSRRDCVARRRVHSFLTIAASVCCRRGTFTLLKHSNICVNGNQQLVIRISVVFTAVARRIEDCVLLEFLASFGIPLLSNCLVIDCNSN